MIPRRRLPKPQVRLGATVHGLLHLPHDLAHAGKTGDILKQLLRSRGHYVALVSTMEDALVAQPKVRWGGCLVPVGM